MTDDKAPRTRSIWYRKTTWTPFNALTVQGWIAGAIFVLAQILWFWFAARLMLWPTGVTQAGIIVIWLSTYVLFWLHTER
jgi:hypothetical protein